MAETETVEFKASVVIIGRFNPLIFHPSWLASQNVIGSDEAKTILEEKQVLVIHPDVTQLKLARGGLAVTENRFAVDIVDPPYIAARDFAMSCFLALNHTPVRAMGINLTTLFRAPSEDAWHSMGDKLAPKDAWRFFLPEVPEGRTRTDGLQQISMHRNRAGDGVPGYTRVKVEPITNRPLRKRCCAPT